MLKSYEVAIEDDRITWLGEKPKFQTTRAIIVIAEENKPQLKDDLHQKRSQVKAEH